MRLDENKHESSFFMTLTELAFIMFFLLLLLLVWSLREKESKLQRRDDEIVQLKEENLVLKERIDGFDFLLEELDIDDAEDFNELVRQIAQCERRIKKLQSQLVESEGKMAGMKAEVEEVRVEEASMERQIRTLRGQIKHFERRFGRGGVDFPPCWCDETGRPEYIYSICIGELNLCVEPAWPDYRKPDLKQIPGCREIIASDLTLAEFRKRAAPILEWSKKNECRHYVIIRDTTESKKAFKQKLLAVEDYFYKYLVRNPLGASQ